MDNISNIHTTIDQGFAAYLALEGFTCLGTIPTQDSFTNHLGKQESKMAFVFIDIPDYANYLQAYTEDTAIGKLKSFHKQTQHMRYYLRNPLSRNEYEKLRGKS